MLIARNGGKEAGISISLLDFGTVFERNDEICIKLQCCNYKPQDSTTVVRNAQVIANLRTGRTWLIAGDTVVRKVTAKCVVEE